MKNNIKVSRERQRITQKKCAELFGVSLRAWQTYEQGTREPKFELLCKIADLFGVTTDYLLNRENVEPEDPLDEFAKRENLEYYEKLLLRKYLSLNKRSREIVKSFLRELKDVPLGEGEMGALHYFRKPAVQLRYSNLAASAGTGDFLSDEFIEEREFEPVDGCEDCDLVIPVNGDSMSPIFEDGDLLMVRLQPIINMGEIGVFILDGSGYVKRYEGDRLVSENSKYRDILLREYPDARCVGKVLGTIKEVEKSE